MADRPVQSLSQAREQTVEQLTVHFANDDLSLDQLEARLELVYRAQNLSELDALTSDLRAATVPPTPATSGAIVRGQATGNVVRQGTVDAHPTPGSGGGTVTFAHDRITSVLSSTKRDGAWSVPERLRVDVVLGDTTIDFTRAILPAGPVDVEVRALFASVKFILPPGLPIIHRIGGTMATVATIDEPDVTTPTPGITVIRLTGWAVASEVKMTVRKVEEPIEEKRENSAEGNPRS